jgi:hypothetical protein
MLEMTPSVIDARSCVLFEAQKLEFSSTCQNNITIMRWTDNNVVHMISPFCGKEPQDTVRRWDKKSKSHVGIQRPNAVKECNRFMGGVDMSDRMVAHYRHAIKNKRFY